MANAIENNFAIHSLFVVRHGYVVLDATFYPFVTGSRHDLASVTKSVTSLAIGAAVEYQLIASATSPVLDLLHTQPSRPDERKQRITVAHLLGMQSGLDCGFRRGEIELHSMMNQRDWIHAVLDLPMRSAPGTEFGYCSGNYHLLSAAIRSITGESEEVFARKRLFEPLGIADVRWPVDSVGNSHGWGDLQLLPSDLAKLGFLMLHGGSWNGEQLVGRDWVIWSTKPRNKYGDDDFYGYGWWTHPDSPPGFYEAMGRGGQRLSVWPEKDLVVVMLGGGYAPGELSPFLLRSLVSDTPLPPNPDGNKRLRTFVERAMQPPPAKQFSASTCANTAMTRRFTVAENPMDLRSFELSFPSSDSAHLNTTRVPRVTGLPAHATCTMARSAIFSPFRVRIRRSRRTHKERWRVLVASFQRLDGETHIRVEARDSAKYDHQRTEARFEQRDLRFLVNAGGHRSPAQMQEFAKRLLLHLETEIGLICGS